MEKVEMNFDKNFIDQKKAEIEKDVRQRAVYRPQFENLSPKDFDKMVKDNTDEIFNSYINSIKKVRTALESYDGVKTNSNIDYISLLSGEEIDTETNLIRQLENRKKVSNNFKKLDSEKIEKIKDFLSLDDNIDMETEITRSKLRMESNEYVLGAEQNIINKDKQKSLMTLEDIRKKKKQALDTIAGENVSEDDLKKAKETLEKIKENFDYSKGGPIKKENNKEYFRKTNKHSMDEVSNRKFGKMGKIGAYAAAGTLILGGLTLALSDSRGQQTNGQLYGQQPLY